MNLQLEYINPLILKEAIQDFKQLFKILRHYYNITNQQLNFILARQACIYTIYAYP